MSRGIILSEAVADTSLPFLSTYDDMIPGPPGFTSWFSSRDLDMNLDTDGRLTSWAPCAGLGTLTPLAAGQRPLRQTGQINGRPALYFDARGRMA